MSPGGEWRGRLRAMNGLHHSSLVIPEFAMRISGIHVIIRAFRWIPDNGFAISGMTGIFFEVQATTPLTPCAVNIKTGAEQADRVGVDWAGRPPQGIAVAEYIQAIG